jgi:hypothetical protein
MDGIQLHPWVSLESVYSRQMLNIQTMKITSPRSCQRRFTHHECHLLNNHLRFLDFFPFLPFFAFVSTACVSAASSALFLFMALMLSFSIEEPPERDDLLDEVVRDSVNEETVLSKGESMKETPSELRIDG